MADNTSNESTITSAVEPLVDDKKEEGISAESDKAIHEGIKRVHNLIVLDERGSMQSIYQPALTGVNETYRQFVNHRKSMKTKHISFLS